jgi:hypothetical protein
VTNGARPERNCTAGNFGQIDAPDVTVPNPPPSQFPDYARVAAVIALMQLPIFFGAWTGYPVYDDGYLQLLIRENGIASIAAAHPDRPIYGVLLELIAHLAGEQKAFYILVNAFLWSILAWQSAILWRRHLPSLCEYGFVLPALCMSPIIVATQFTTVTTALTAVLPACLVMAALLIGLRPRRGVATHAMMAGLLVSAVAISEYGTAAAMGSIVLLFGMKSFRAALIASVAACAGYGIFTSLADLSVRPEVDPVVKLSASWLNLLINTPLRLISVLWAVVIGGYGKALSLIHVLADSKSTIVSVFAGAALSAVMVAFHQRANRTRDVADASQSRGQENNEVRAIASTLLATAAALLPVLLMKPTLDTDPFETRFAIPALPFAVFTTAAVCLRVLATASPARVSLLALIGFLCGYTSTSTAFEMRRQQLVLESLGRVVKDGMRNDSHLHVVVVPELGWAAQLAAKATSRWTVEQERRTWFLSPREAARHFGDRLSCSRADFLRYEMFRGLRRVGPVTSLHWASFAGGRLLRLEPYCLSEERSRPATNREAALRRPAESPYLN